jgi:DNA-binding NarL/FixJ family response regulator
MIRVLIADDQEMVREGLSVILGAQADIEVVATAADGVEAVASSLALRPDVILMDIRMPGMDGIEATRAIVAGTTASRIIVLTTFDADSYVLASLSAGASGFLVKDTPRQQLLAAVRSAAEGNVQLPPDVLIRLLATIRPAPLDAGSHQLADRVTPREREVLSCLASGANNLEIAQTLFIGEATVKTHVAHLQDKLHVRDRVQLVLLAYRSGLGDGAVARRSGVHEVT